MAEGRPRDLHQPFAVLGRDPAMDLVLDHPEVSRRHAYFQVIGGRLFAVDLGSRTGIFWGDDPASMGWIRGGEGVRIGPFRIMGDASDVNAGPSRGEGLPTSRAFEQAGLGGVTLEFLDGTQPKASWRINRALVLLGRSKLCKLRLPGPDISKIHASLVSTTEGLWVVDLLSRGGVFVNGVKVRSDRLVDGDELRVGINQIRVRHEVDQVQMTRAIVLPTRSARSIDAPSSGPSHPEAGQLAASAPDRGLFLEGKPELADPLAVALLSEFGQVQQQMAEQFQQSLLMMFQMFRGMHQDQMGLIREELEQIRRLASEQQAIQADLARRPPAPTERPAFRLHSPDSDADSPAPMGDGKPAGTSAASPAQDVPRSAGTPERTPPRPHPAAGRDSEDLHASLVRRLAAIQEERQGRWQKLIGSMMGKGPGANST